MPTAPISGGLGKQPVAFMRSEVAELLWEYGLVRDCTSGSKTVKAATQKYLPMPNKQDQSKANKDRYYQYITRATFFNATKRTILGMVGQIFLRDPQLDLPSGLTVLESDADGQGGTINQLIAQSCRYLLAFGRCGVLTDFPTPAKPAVAGTPGNPQAAPGANLNYFTQQELAEGDVRPTMKVYNSQQIINWREGMRGARKIPTMIVLSDMNYVTGDGFSIKAEPEYVVLKLLSKEDALVDIQRYGKYNAVGLDYNDLTALGFSTDTTDVYKQEVWRWNKSTNQAVVYHYYPTDVDGKFLNEIPFRIMGCDKNEFTPVEPPVYDLAEVNIAHYRNSADYEESVFVNGQVTFVVAGLTEEWADKFFANGVAVGSRGVVPLPEGGQAQFLQAAANGIVREAMQDKERQMVALGAKLIEQRNVARTATEASIESSSESSILSTIATNVATAMSLACKDACKYTGDAPDQIVIKLNTEFDLQKMDPNERFELLTEWVNGALTWEELRDNLRRGGIANLDDKTAKADLAAEQQQRQDQAVANAKQMAEALPQPAAPAPGDGTAKKVVPPKKPAQPGGGKDKNQQ